METSADTVREFATANCDRITELVEQDDNTGLCIKCGAEQSGCEPDARWFHCDACGARAVFGAEELLLYVDITQLTDDE